MGLGTPLIICQARMESMRFPGKVLAPMQGQPMLLWHLARLTRMQTPCHVVVASPLTTQNRQLQEVLRRHGYDCRLVPGDPSDVLTRYCTLAAEYEAELIVRTTGDCPLIDPAVIDALVAWWQHTGGLLDHLALAQEWPDGLDAEVCTRAALNRASAVATTRSEREHVTPRIWRYQDEFACQAYPCPFDWTAYQWSVDTRQDAQYVGRLLRYALARYGLEFRALDLVQLMDEHPDLLKAMQQRGPRNNAYAQQVTAETGQATDWATLRRTGGRHG